MKAPLRGAMGVAAMLMAYAGGAWAADAVWRHVDEATGQVVYSNVPGKGKKWERIDIMKYPPPVEREAPPEVSVRESTPRTVEGVAIPPEILRELKGGGARPPIPPMELPPLPTKGAEEQSQRVVEKPKLEMKLRPSIPGQDKEPSWAKDKPAAEQLPPSWASDPFSGH